MTTNMQSGSATIPPELLDQGDGVYIASLNETGHVNVEFTPSAGLTKRVLVKDVVGPSPTHGLHRRDGVTCSGREALDLKSLNQANVDLSNNMNNKTYNKVDWGWVSSSGAGCAERSAANTSQLRLRQK